MAKGGGRARGGGARSSGRGGAGRDTSGRNLKVRVKTAKRRSISSTRWLERQLNDPYVAEARKRGYRSRAAFKLIQLDDRFHFLKSGARIVDLGCAPGGWLQVVAERCGRSGRIVGIDLQEVEPVTGADLLVGDFLDDDAPDRLKTALGGPADVVLSDMAASSTGHAKTDHLRVMALAEAAHLFAREVLAPGGAFVAKVLQGGTERGLLTELKRDFAKVNHVKPAASRADSAEMYLVATGFRGARPEEDDEDGGSGA
ncbi:RlmE family RNA methyltransferase [Pelagibius marinus]|uniref:RlmE family RNA methyltransferase n=1 Tax=Pelagibius marinus TaxID=2762760 RepID=UPI001872E8EC|nr:RlmE family RNA methyltransferase [Pelagibius marinus]